MLNHTTSHNQEPVENEKMYHGTPCRRHGHTLRYKSTGHCVACSLDAAKKWRAENLEKSRASGRRAYRKNPTSFLAKTKQWRVDNPGKAKATKDRWARNNPEKVKGYRRNWNQGNREKSRASSKRWRLTNPLKVRAIKQRRRAKLAGVPSVPYDFQAICAIYDNCCLRCGAQSDLTIDHVIPISKGGPDTLDNIQPLCRGCNSAKGVKLTDYRVAL